jgi:dipeptidyl aminopeptidase/acylaminoacyl peptidase
MTSESRVERDLPGILGDLAMGPYPDYIDDVLATTAHRRQRPAWTFPERWLPMDLTTQAAPTARMPWRQLGVLALIGILLALALAAYVGSQPRLPDPFGIAGNGQIAVSRDGDIAMIDPVTGAMTTIVTGPDTDFAAQVSLDGTRVAFLRERVDGDVVFHDIVVADDDGSGQMVITPRPVINGIGMFAWSPDSRSILADLDDNDELRLYDATSMASPRTITVDILEPIGLPGYPGMTTYLAPFQPPDGRAILIQRQTSSGNALVVLDLETLQQTVLAEGTRKDDLGGARWSPDGTQVVYNASPADDPASQRLFVVNADGTGSRQITDAPGTWYDIDPSWSPTGDRIAFTRYESTASGWDVRPIGVYSLADETVRDVGPLPRETRAAQPNAGDSDASAGEGFAFEWSPDGTSLIAVPGEGATHPVLIDVATGEWRNLDPVVDPHGVFQSWQRTAP